MVLYRITLSEKGKEIFKGGNIEIMGKPLIRFKAKGKKEAEQKFYNILNESIGFASEYLYKIEEIKKWTI